VNLDQLCAEAMKRINHYINRAAAQHLYHMANDRHQTISVTEKAKPTVSSVGL
jgi:hypothetical protein